MMRGTPVERSFKGSFNEELINLLSDLSSELHLLLVIS